MDLTTVKRSTRRVKIVAMVGKGGGGKTSTAKRLAIDRRSTSQKLMEEALDDLFIKYLGKPR